LIGMPDSTGLPGYARPFETLGVAAAAAWRRSDAAARWRFCLRMTVAAVLAFAVSHVLNIPLQGLWAVLTALVVTQISVGESLRATTEYVVGTIAGAVYAGAIGVLVPHSGMLALTGLLALTVAPLALAAALSPSFRVAPFTGAIVLLLANQFGEGLLESALYRVLEVALGGATAIVVSLLLVPDRAHGLTVNAAARILDRLAFLLSELMAGLTRPMDEAEIRRIHDDVGRSIGALQTIASEARRERRAYLVAAPDPGPLSRTLLRLRHDLVIIGRAAVTPLPEALLTPLAPALARVEESAATYLRESAAALASRRSPPPIDDVTAALESYESAVAALHGDARVGTLSSSEVGRIFTLGFALVQLRQDLGDLERIVNEHARLA